MKITEALHAIVKQDLVLPEFQREYVWTKEQARTYPINRRRLNWISKVRSYSGGAFSDANTWAARLKRALGSVEGRDHNRDPA
jgi:hypothetical protein